jgi:hypothetical protein
VRKNLCSKRIVIMQRKSKLAKALTRKLHVTWRIGDCAESDRRLLLQRLVPFADDKREFCLVIASEGTRALALWRIAALSRHRLAVSRLGCFAACSGAPSHWLPLGSDGQADTPDCRRSSSRRVSTRGVCAPRRQDRPAPTVRSCESPGRIIPATYSGGATRANYRACSVFYEALNWLEAFLRDDNIFPEEPIVPIGD